MTKVIKPSKRQIILEEAAKLFKDKGYGGTSMRDIAGQVGMEAASMYNHIKSKDEILDSICFRISDVYIAHLHEVEVLPLTFGEKVRALIRLHIQLMVEDGPAVSVANHDWKYLPNARLQEFTVARRQYEKGFAALIAEGIAAGEFSGGEPYGGAFHHFIGRALGRIMVSAGSQFIGPGVGRPYHYDATQRLGAKIIAIIT